MKSSFIRLFLIFIGSFVPLFGSNSSNYLDLKSYSTLHSIGLELTIDGDDNHNAICKLYYKRDGQEDYKRGLDLFRIDMSSKDNRVGFNGFSGSIMKLSQDRFYEVKIECLDSDNGEYKKVLFIKTKKMPQKPKEGRILHIIPGSGGGDGSEANPFRGIKEANLHAKAGDTFLLHKGRYSGRDIILDRAGRKDNYIVYQSANDGEVSVEYLMIAANYIWIEGLHFFTDKERVYGAIRSQNNPKEVVITHNSFDGFHYSIDLVSRNTPGGEGWIITHNKIVGDNPLDMEDGSKSWKGEGIELATTKGGHTIAYNTISHTADAISSPQLNCDIYGNEIFDVTDDGVEMDMGYANVRVWDNRLTNIRHHAFSFQPMNRGPWYIFKNQVISDYEAILKYSYDYNTSRALIANNTFLTWGWGFMMPPSYSDFTFRLRNNIWVALGDKPYYDLLGNRDESALFRFSKDSLKTWKGSLDFDGYDFGSRRFLFNLSDKRGYDFETFKEATKEESHAVVFNMDECFEGYDVGDGDWSKSIPFSYLSLKSGCPLIDKGVRLANINDDFYGTAPDIGSNERGALQKSFGAHTINEPTNLEFKNISSTSVELTWMDRSDNESGFKIYRDAKLIYKTSPNVSSYIDRNLEPNRVYHYTIKATDE